MTTPATGSPGPTAEGFPGPVADLSGDALRETHHRYPLHNPDPATSQRATKFQKCGAGIKICRSLFLCSHPRNTAENGALTRQSWEWEWESRVGVAAEDSSCHKGGTCGPDRQEVMTTVVGGTFTKGSHAHSFGNGRLSWELGFRCWRVYNDGCSRDGGGVGQK